MPELDSRQRDRLSDADFAYIDEDGERHLPINDEGHVRNALARFNQTDFKDAASKRHAAKRIIAAARHHGIDLDAHDDVVRAARD